MCCSNLTAYCMWAWSHEVQNCKTLLRPRRCTVTSMADQTEHRIVSPDTEMDKDALRVCMALLHAGAAMAIDERPEWSTLSNFSWEFPCRFSSTKASMHSEMATGVVRGSRTSSRVSRGTMTLQTLAVEIAMNTTKPVNPLRPPAVLSVLGWSHTQINLGWEPYDVR